MATLMLEGWDALGPPSSVNPTVSALLLQKWNTVTGVSFTLHAPLGPSGYALSLFNGFIQKTLTANYGRLIGGFRFTTNLFDNSGISFLTGAGSPVAQCTITINNSTGLISVRTGSLGGTILATSGVSVTSGTTHYLEFDITFGASAAYHVWLDGASIGLSGTGNTAGGGGTTANVFSLNSNGPNNSTMVVDDFYLFDPTGSNNNAVLNTNPFIITNFPTSDSQTQWSNLGDTLIPTGIAQTSVAALTSNTNTPGANKMLLVRCQAPVAETLNSVKFLPQTTNAGANFQPVVYSDSAGSRGSILSGGAQVVGSVSGTALNLPLSGGVSLGSGTFYWVGFFSDSSIAVSQYDATTNLGETYNGTYASGSGSFTSGLSTGQATFLIWGDCTGGATNWESVDGNPIPGNGPSGDDAAIQTSTSTAQDFYGSPALPAYVAVVYSVAVEVSAKGISGAPSVGTAILSNGTTGYGSLGSSGTPPPTGSYGTISSNFDVDPHTSAAWTVAAVNAEKIGPFLQ